MILFIDSSQRGNFFLALLDSQGRILKQKQFKAFAEKFLYLIDQFAPVKKLKGIIVNAGPGDFSPLRAGAVLANTLSFALKIKAVPVEGRQIKKGLKKLKRKKQELIMPKYGKEPGITIPK